MYGANVKALDLISNAKAIRRFSQVSREEDFDFNLLLEQGRLERGGDEISVGMLERPIEGRRGSDSGRRIPQKRRRRRKNKSCSDKNDGGNHAHGMISRY